MKLIYFGFDFFAGVLRRVLVDGHEVARLYTYPTDNRWNFNREVLRLARRHRIPVSFGKPLQAEIDALTRGGAELLLVCGYPHKVPCSGWVRGVNLHPSLLPEGRGRWPLPWQILRYPEAAGLTLHKLTESWDSGDVLLRHRLTLSETDDLETLTARLQMAAPPLVSRLLGELDAHWRAAIPQEGGSYWRLPGPAERRLDGGRTVAENLRIVRAFGNFGSGAAFDGSVWNVTAASGWVEPHDLPPGSVVHRSGGEATLAVADGFVVLRQFRRDVPPGVGRRMATAVRRRYPVSLVPVPLWLVPLWLVPRLRE